MKPGSAFQLPLEILRDQIITSTLLPEEHAKYRLVLAEALSFFLEQLPRDRLRRIFIEQSGLPFSTPVESRVVALLHHGPALHKLGQVLARDRRLSRAFRLGLQGLETMEPVLTHAEVLRLVEKGIPRWKALGLALAPAPLAEGSVAVVMPFRDRSHHEGVLKLLKPGIKRLLEEDLAALGKLGDFLDTHCHRVGLPGIDYHETFELIRQLLLNEVRLDHEQKNVVEAAESLASLAEARVPALFPFSNSAVTAMERLYGKKITDATPGDAVRREQWARAIAKALVAEPMFSPRENAVFHSDPHAGNLLAGPEGRLGILDWSLAGHLDRRTRELLVQVLLAALTRRPELLEDAIRNFSPSSRSSTEAFRPIVESSLRGLRWGEPPGACWLTDLLDNLVLQAQLPLQPGLLLFRKTWLSVEGVLWDLLGSNESMRRVMDETIMASFLERWVAEWPGRFHQPMHAPGAATHVSNVDILRVLASLPSAWTAGWTDSVNRLCRGFAQGWTSA